MTTKKKRIYISLISVFLACQPTLSNAAIFQKKKDDIVQVSLHKLESLKQLVDSNDYKNRLAEVGLIEGEGKDERSALAALAATAGVEMAVDAVVAALKKQADKHEASFDGLLAISNMSDEYVGLEIRRYKTIEAQSSNDLAFRAIFAMVKDKTNGVYWIHPIYLNIQEPKARVWGKLMSVSISCEFDVGQATGSGVKRHNIKLPPLLVKTYQKGVPMYFPGKATGFISIPFSQGYTDYRVQFDQNGDVELTPGGTPKFEYAKEGADGEGKKVVKESSSRNTPVVVKMNVVELDKGKAAKVLRKVAKTIDSKKSDVVKIILDQ